GAPRPQPTGEDARDPRRVHQTLLPPRLGARARRGGRRPPRLGADLPHHDGGDQPAHRRSGVLRLHRLPLALGVDRGGRADAPRRPGITPSPRGSADSRNAPAGGYGWVVHERKPSESRESTRAVPSTRSLALL